MALNVQYQPKARKELHLLPEGDKLRVHQRVEAYAADPASTAHDAVPLRGMEFGYRLRVGDWRVIFEMTETTMTIRRVAHRREAYR